MKQFLLTALTLILMSTSLLCQNTVTVFRTYEDFANQKGEKYDGYEYSFSFHKVGKWSCIFKKKGSKNLVLNGKRVWGFEYKEHLFRHHFKSTLPYALISYKKIAYYENGHAVLDMLKNNSDKGSYSYGESHLFSADINSELNKLEFLIYGKKKHKTKCLHR